MPFFLLGVVRLTPNVALRGTATQSHTHIYPDYASSPFLASYSNDGNFQTSMTATSTSGACSIAESSKPPVWWQVDLLKIYHITKVAITGRSRLGKCVFDNFNFQCNLLKLPLCYILILVHYQGCARFAEIWTFFM